MFTTKPKAVKQPKVTSPPSTMPKTKQKDELFTASTEGSSVVGEQPSQGDTDVVEPAKPAKKKPAGAVSMFGGVDLFGGKVGGGSKSPSIASSVTEEKPQETAPVTVPEEKTKKPVTVGGTYQLSLLFQLNIV